MEVGRLEAGGWRLEAGDWRLETGDWRLETGDWRGVTRSKALPWNALPLRLCRIQPQKQRIKKRPVDGALPGFELSA